MSYTSVLFGEQTRGREHSSRICCLMFFFKSILTNQSNFFLITINNNNNINWISKMKYWISSMYGSARRSGSYWPVLALWLQFWTLTFYWRASTKRDWELKQLFVKMLKWFGVKWNWGCFEIRNDIKWVWSGFVFASWTVATRISCKYFRLWNSEYLSRELLNWLSFLVSLILLNLNSALLFQWIVIFVTYSTRPPSGVLARGSGAV